VETVATVGADGWLELPRVETSTLEVTALETDERADLDPRTGRSRTLPWGVSEAVIVGADSLRRPLDLTAPSGVPCGFGPLVRIGKTEITTRVVATVGDLLSGESVPALPCGSSDASVQLGSGSTDVVVRATAEFAAESLRLTGSPPAGDPERGDVAALAWGTADRRVQIAAAQEETVLVVHENANSGWTATLDGAPLEPLSLDGWQQGWVLPAGAAGVVELTFAPDRIYRLSLVVGLVAALGLVLLGLRPERRRAAAPRSMRAPALFREAAAPAVGLLLGGAVGLVIGIAARLLVRFARPSSAPLVAGAGLVGAGLVAAALPWPGADTGSFSLSAQVLALTGMLVVLASGGRRTRPPGPES
jgi:arabinofuranan 3-O-arabinosyltransferase